MVSCGNCECDLQGSIEDGGWEWNGNGLSLWKGAIEKGSAMARRRRVARICTLRMRVSCRRWFELRGFDKWVPCTDSSWNKTLTELILQLKAQWSDVRLGPRLVGVFDMSSG